MVLLKGKVSLLTFLGLFLFAASNVWAASSEVLEWRVDSDLKKLETPPSVSTGLKTPFPVRVKPVVVVESRNTEPVLTESQIKAMEAADLLNDIREFLSREDIFSVDVSDVVVDALMKGDKGYSILVKNKWYKEGDLIDVPAIARESLLALVEELEALDPSVANVVEEQVAKKIENVRSLKLKVVSVDDSRVNFVDEQGEKHVISFKPKNL